MKCLLLNIDYSRSQAPSYQILLTFHNIVTSPKEILVACSISLDAPEEMKSKNHFFSCTSTHKGIVILVEGLLFGHEISFLVHLLASCTLTHHEVLGNDRNFMYRMLKAIKIEQLRACPFTWISNR